MPNIEIRASVRMGGIDLSRYVTALACEQSPRELHRTWGVTLTGWTHVDRAARWDIFLGYGDGGEVLIRQGVIPPDWQPSIAIGPQSAPASIEIRGVDWAWLATRMRRPDTIVIAPNRAQARRAIRTFREQTRERPIGRVTFFDAETMHDAIKQLGVLAGFSVVPLIPNYKMQGYVCDPEHSVWQSIWELCSVFAPFAFARRERNEIVIADRPFIGRGQNALSIGISAISAVRIEPIRESFLRRVLVRIPAWADVKRIEK